MITKEKVYIIVPLSLHRERGMRGQPVKFSARTRWEEIIVVWAVKLTLTPLHRGGGVVKLVPRTDINTTKTKGAKGEEINFKFSLPPTPNLNFSLDFNQ